MEVGKKLVKVGIDPGLSGAIAFVSDDMIKFFDMPIMVMPWVVTSKYKNKVDGNKLYNIIKNCPYEIESITIEIVGVQQGQGISSSAAFMGAFHTVLAISSLFMEPRMIRPQKWKNKWGLINQPKDMSRLTVLKMYPNLLPQLKRKKDVDRAEALLIAVS